MLQLLQKPCLLLWPRSCAESATVLRNRIAPAGIYLIRSRTELIASRIRPLSAIRF